MEQQYTKIILKSGKEQSLLRFHPWVFSGAVKRAEGPLAEGDVVEVISHRGDFLGLGHYQVGSIMVRLFSFRPVVPDFAFWKVQLQKAWDLRHSLGLANNPETNVFRLVNGEGDGFPGLIIDFYNGVAVMQMHSLGMYRIRQELAAALKEILGDRLLAVYDKSEKTLPFKADISPHDGYLLGEARQTEVSEYGLRFKVDWEAGQKTGFFIDQRENRRLVQQYAAGRDVLNMFCYTGGFSFFALRGGARLVHSVDASARAIALTNENVTLNFADEARHQAFVADAADFLKNIKDQYDLIILDPPAFSKHRDTLGQALQAYKRLNARAFEQIRPGGLLFTFSCSQVVSKEKFREAVFSGAAIAGRSVRILHQLTQPADHPVNIYHPEGEYLKGLVLWVE